MALKAAIFDPYLDTLGGGERYCLTIAEILIKEGYSVDLFWSGDPQIIKAAKERFSLILDKINLVPNIFPTTQASDPSEISSEQLAIITSRHVSPPNLVSKARAFYNRYRTMRQYNLFFYLGDGSIPFLFSHRNYLHVQVPFSLHHSLKEKLINQLKYRLIRRIICNSRFTEKFTRSSYNSNTSVIYPPVDIEKFDPKLSKENIILSVGRFDNILNAKKQDILIQAFSRLHQSGHFTGWKLMLVGGSLDRGQENTFLQHLRFLAKGLPVDFVVNPDFLTLKEIYSRSKIYWHGAGFGVDENLHPENTEHFGITVVEAMASGLVPLVVAKGGLPETVEDGVSGFLWPDIDTLISKTQLLIASEDLYHKMSESAVKSSIRFSKNNFSKTLLDLIRR